MAVEISGKITLSDGSVSEFTISEATGYAQWGADTARLGRSQPIVNALTDALLDVLPTEDEED